MLTARPALTFVLTAVVAALLLASCLDVSRQEVGDVVADGSGGCTKVGERTCSPDGRQVLECGTDKAPQVVGTCDANTEVCDGGACVAALGCGELFACFVACPETFPTNPTKVEECQTVCREASSPNAQTDYGRFLQCYESAGCAESAETLVCVADSCAGATAQCLYGLLPLGPTACRPVFACSVGCDQPNSTTRDSCVEGCVSGSTGDARSQLVAISLCLAGVCGDPDREGLTPAQRASILDCMQKQTLLPLSECRDEWQACES